MIDYVGMLPCLPIIKSRENLDSVITGVVFLFSYSCYPTCLVAFQMVYRLRKSTGLTPCMKGVSITHTSPDPDENKENIPPGHSKRQSSAKRNLHSSLVGQPVFEEANLRRSTRCTPSKRKGDPSTGIPSNGGSPPKSSRPERSAKLVGEVRRQIYTVDQELTPSPKKSASRRTPSKCEPSSLRRGRTTSTPSRTTSTERSRGCSVGRDERNPSRGEEKRRVLVVESEEEEERTEGGKKGREVTVIKAQEIKLTLKKIDSSNYRIRTGNTPKTPRGPTVQKRSAARQIPTSYSSSSSDVDSSESEEGDYAKSSSEDYGSERSEEMEREEQEEDDEEKVVLKSARRKMQLKRMEKRAYGDVRTRRVFDEEEEVSLHTASSSLVGALERLSSTRSARGILLCREKLCLDIRDVIWAAIQPGGVSQACYISGVPGTGKTASVKAMVNDVLNDRRAPPFIFIDVNAMYFTEAKQLFAEVWSQYEQQMGGTKHRRMAGQTARKRLNALFETTDENRPPILMLVDELDHLCTKKQELIYDIFNWTALKTARVSVISISNTNDLPERMLNQRICSRLGMNRVMFQPYTHQEIQQIVEAKLRGETNEENKTKKGMKKRKGKEDEEGAVDASSVEFAARKVAAVAGDLRKAIDILKTAVEIAIASGKERLEIEQVLAATRETSSSLLAHAVDSMTTHQLTVLDAAVDIVRMNEVEEFSWFELLEKYDALCLSAFEMQPLNEDCVWRMLLTLAASSLVSFSNPSDVRYRRRIRLNPDVSSAMSAIKMTREKRKKGEKE